MDSPRDEEDDPAGPAEEQDATPARTYRSQTAREEIANSISHGLGLLGSLFATSLLIRAALRRGSVIALVSDGIFGMTVILLYLASTLYHALPIGRGKRFFALADNAAIFLLIAGTYTPFTLDVLRDTRGWALFGIIWVLALAGVLMTVVGRFGHRSPSAGLYLSMGWIFLVAILPLARRLPGSGLWLLIGGGLIYTAGVPFYAANRVRYNHFVWHLFVLTGTACHFVVLLRYSG